MPNPRVCKEVKFQHRMEGSSVTSWHCRNSSDSSSAERRRSFTTPSGQFWRSKLSRLCRPSTTQGLRVGRS